MDELNKEIASQQVELANAFNALQQIKKENIKDILIEKKQNKDIKMLSEQIPKRQDMDEEFKQAKQSESDKDIQPKN